MTNWQEDNLSTIMEYPFDFDRYIAEQLREIDDLDERRFAKTVLVEGLGRMIHQTEQKYKELENRIYQEISIPNNQYEIASTIARRSHYDPTNETLFPVYPLELKDARWKEALSTEESIYAGTIYIQGNRQMCREFEQAGAYTGTITIGAEEKTIECCIKKADRYRLAVETLYRMFLDNHIPWETVNIGYLDKFYDLYIPAHAVKGIKTEYVTLENTNINFGKYNPAVIKDMIPLWNIETITFDSRNFMIPCIDGIYYEHEFLMEEKNRQDGYLIQTNDEILEIRHEQGKIIIKSKQEFFEGWKAFRIVQENTVRSLDYDAPILSNHKQDTFIRRLSGQSKVTLLTKADLFRRIMELDILEYIEIVEYEILEDGKKFPSEESMNWFVRDEVFPMESRKVLLLKFKARDNECYLNDTFMWFVISQIQMEIGEYFCVGLLV